MPQQVYSMQAHVIHIAYWGLNRVGSYQYKLVRITRGAETDFFREGEDVTSPRPTSSPCHQSFQQSLDMAYWEGGFLEG